MWINKTERGPHAEPENAKEEELKLVRTRSHRERAKETTLFAKYSYELRNLEMVGADPDSNGKCWTLTVPADPAKRTMRQMRKKKHDTPGVEYSLK